MIDQLIAGCLVLVVGLHTVDEIHNCHNPRYIENKEYDNFVCNWERTDFDYVTDENGKVMIDTDKCALLVLKKEVATDSKVKKKYRDKYWENR